MAWAISFGAPSIAVQIACLRRAVNADRLGSASRAASPRRGSGRYIRAPAWPRRSTTSGVGWLEQEFFELQRYGARQARKKGILTDGDGRDDSDAPAPTRP